MASTNQSPFYQKAEQEYLQATTDEERIACLEVMIRECPKHKSSEKMLSNLKSRLKKLKENVERQKKSQKGSLKQGIRKADMQAVLIGYPNTGKSTIFNILTDNKPYSQVSINPYSTREPIIGICKFEDVQIQIIDDAPIPNQDRSLVNSTDTLLIVIDQYDQLEKIEEHIWKSRAKRLYLMNKTDNLNEEELRKLKAKISSKYPSIKIIFINHNAKKTEIEELKKELFKTFPIIRVYTKEPKKEPSTEPMILKENSTIGDAAEKIHKDLSKKVKYAKVWGPSAKFSGQIVGLDHKLKDKDIIELQTK